MRGKREKTMMFARSLFVTACLLKLVVLAGAQTAADTTTTTLFEGARLIVGDGTAPIENSAFIVDHGKFTRIGRKSEIQAPAGAARVDLTGKTVMPAMIDSHGHLGPTRQDYIDSLNLSAYLGIAATTSMGRDTWEAFLVRAEAPINAARLLTCGRGMVGPLGLEPETIAAGTAGRLPEDLHAFELQIATPVEAREHVRELATQMVDCIKIWATDRGGLEVMMSPPVYQAIIDEAHRHNLQVFSDSWSLQQFKELTRAGLDGFAHPVRDRDVDDEFLQLLKDRPNVFMQTNLQMTEARTHTEDPAWLKEPLLLDIATPELLKKMSAGSPSIPTHEGWVSSDIAYARQRYSIMTRNTAKLFKAGVPYAVGTDEGGTFSYHVELELLVRDVGLTPSQTITMATRDGALGP